MTLNKLLFSKSFVFGFMVIALFASSPTQAGKMSNGQNTYRFGRYAINLPRFSYVSVNAVYRGTKVMGPIGVASYDALKEKLDRKSRQYASSSMGNTDELNDMLRQGGLDPHKLIGDNQLVTYRLDPANSLAIMAYRPSPTSAYVTVDAYKVSDTGTYKFEVTQRIATDVERYVGNLRAAALVFQSAKDSAHAPSGAFCILAGCFDDKGAKPLEETVDLVAVIGSHADAKLRIYAESKNSENQLTNDPRNAENDDGETLAQFGIKPTVVRKGKRTLVDQNGFEVAESIEDPQSHGRKSFLFIWAANGRIHDPRHQIIKVELRISPTSDGTSTISTFQQADTIWENLVSSFRLM